MNENNWKSMKKLLLVDDILHVGGNGLLLWLVSLEELVEDLVNLTNHVASCHGPSPLSICLKKWVILKFKLSKLYCKILKWRRTLLRIEKIAKEYLRTRPRTLLICIAICTKNKQQKTSWTRPRTLKGSVQRKLRHLGFYTSFKSSLHGEGSAKIKFWPF